VSLLPVSSIFLPFAGVTTASGSQKYAAKKINKVNHQAQQFVFLALE